MITKSYIQQEPSRKNIGFRLVYLTLPTIFSRPLKQVISVFFYHKKKLSVTTNILKIKGNFSCNISWALNQFDLSWQESTSNHINCKRWVKIKAYIQLIEINSLLYFSWINNNSIKWKLFMSKSNILNCILFSGHFHSTQIEWVVLMVCKAVLGYFS